MTLTLESGMLTLSNNISAAQYVEKLLGNIVLSWLCQSRKVFNLYSQLIIMSSKTCIAIYLLFISSTVFCSRDQLVFWRSEGKELKTNAQLIQRRGGSEYNWSRKLPYFRSGKRKFSAHFSGLGHKNCKRNGNILFRALENGNCQYNCDGYRKS